MAKSFQKISAPLEAGMGFAVKVAKESDFIGKEALAKLKEEGLKRKIVAT